MRNLAKEWDDYKIHQKKAEKSLTAWERLKHEIDNMDSKYLREENTGRMYTYIKRIDVINLIKSLTEEV